MPDTPVVPTVVITPKVKTVTQPGEPPPPRAVVLALGTYMVAMNLALVYLLLNFWPGTVPFGPRDPVSLFMGRMHVSLWIETRYLLLVVLAAALGSYVHLATSFVDFIGNRKFVATWTWWYLLRPFIGMALALVVYFVVRAGLVGTSAGAENLSPYGVSAIAGMCGLFSKQATDKLREVFENLFRAQSATQRADPLASDENEG